MESTYGDRYHGKHQDYVTELTNVIQRTFDRGGNVVIPSFAVGRTQELLYFIRKIKEESGISDIKVVATGGLGRIVADATDSIDVYDAHLTLQGIRLIYEKTKAARQKG